MGDDDLEALRSAEATPLAQLQPEIDDAASRVVDGVVTITWPYSSVTRSTAFILADRDYHLRSRGGQIRVEFRAAAAKALADASIGGGDEVRVSLKGAQWRKLEPQMRLPQGSSEWQLLFESRLLLSLRRAQDQSCDVIDIDLPHEADGGLPESQPPQAVPMVSAAPIETAFLPVSDPVGPSSLPVKRQAPPEFETDEFVSPAFIKRARMSYGALLEEGLGLDLLFDGEKEKKRSKKKKKRFSFFRQAASWKYSSRSPSPVAGLLSGYDTDGSEASMNTGAEAAEKSTKTSPPRPTMVDGASQTQEVYFSPSVTGGHVSIVPSVVASRRGHQKTSNDDFHTPSRTLFERPFNQHLTSRRTGHTMSYGAQSLGLTTETRIGSSSATNHMVDAAAFTRSTPVPHYPAAALGNNQPSVPAMSIDPSLQYPNEIHADEHLYYATEDFAWHVDASAGETSLASVGAGVRDSAPIMTASSSGRSRRLVSPVSGSMVTSRLPSSQFERRSSIERAQEAGLMDQDHHHNAYPSTRRASGEEYSLATQVGADDDDAEHNLDEMERENEIAAEEVGDPLNRYGNSRFRRSSYSSDGRSDARVGANYDMQGQYQDGYEVEYGSEYNAQYGANESDGGSDSVPATPRKPVVIDLLSDSDEEPAVPDTAASRAVDEPTTRRQYETRSSEADDDEASNRSDADVEDAVSHRSEADTDENEASARSLERSDADMEENDDLTTSHMDAREGEVSDKEVGGADAAVRFVKSSVSVASDEDVGRSNVAPRGAESPARSFADLEEAEASARSDVGSEASARSQSSARFEADDENREASAGSAKSQTSSTSEAHMSKADDMNQGTEQGEASGGWAHDTDEEAASGEHERASEEDSQRDDSVMDDARHANEELQPAEEAGNSCSSEEMSVEVNEAPDHAKSIVEGQAEEGEGEDEDDELVEAIAEESDMDVNVMTSQPAGHEDGDAASRLDARAEESDMDVEYLASQPPRPDVDGAPPSSQAAEEDDVTEHVGMDSKEGASESEMPGHVEVAVVIPQHLGQDVGDEEQTCAEVNEDEERLFEGRASGQTADSNSDDEFQDAPTSPQNDQEELQYAEARDEDVPREESTQMGNQKPPSPRHESQPEQEAEEMVKAETQATTEHHDSEMRDEDEERDAPDASQTSTRSLRDRSLTKSKGQELEVLIPSRSLRQSLKASSAASQELGDEDPSVALAQAAASPQSSGFGPGKETRSAARLRAASSNHRSDQTDPSLRLARATVSEAAQAKDGSPTTRKADGPTKRSKRRQATPETTTTPRELRSSGRASSPVESVQASPSTTATGSDEETAEAKRKLLATLRTRLPESVPLQSLRSQLNRTVDVMAMSTMTPAQPHRPKHGPRDYMLELVLTDASTAPGKAVVAQMFRPHVESLPVVQAGDVVLLRRVQVMSLQGREFGVRAGEASAWAVFEKDETEMLAQIKGPPVEVTEGEIEYARGLKQWWALVTRNERAMARVEKATEKKITRAKEAKDRA
ncbi:hypothetical protein CP533_2656 [Ophiocordyceps camponoti-saundersi (nom. inval.)]|nr:hypothetical protein CP533_2656 [Ophiocordyceps camponoti-saundersi (nom. inval.)]